MAYVRELVRYRQGIKKVLKKSKKFDRKKMLKMSSCENCAISTFLGTSQFSQTFNELFGFYPAYTKESSKCNLEDIWKKRVNYLFVSSRNTVGVMTVKEWRKKAKKTLAKIENEILRGAK